MSDLVGWADGLGLSKIKGPPSEDKLSWALDTISKHPETISTLDADELTDLLMVFNSWHLHIRKELGIQKGYARFESDNKDRAIKIASLLEICDAVKEYIACVKSVYFNRGRKEKSGGFGA
jgi:hypothetical protein